MSNFPTPNDWALALYPLFAASNPEESDFDACFKELTDLYVRKDRLLKTAQRSKKLTQWKRNSINHGTLRKSLKISAKHLGTSPQDLLVYIYESNAKEALVEC